MASSNEQPPSTEALESSLRNTTDGTPSSRPASTKVVSIAEPEATSVSPKGTDKNPEQHDQFGLEKAAKQFRHRASVSGKRLSGRPSLERLVSAGRASMASNPSLTSLLSDDSAQSPKGSHHHHEGLVKQVSAWLKHEKTRRAARRAKRKGSSAKGHESETAASEQVEHPSTDDVEGKSDVQGRRGSDSSEGSVALEQLAHILERTLSLKSTDSSSIKRRSSHSHRLSSYMKRHSTVSSDTEYFESIQELVPSCEATLDNSKTLAYGAGGPESSEDSGTSGKKNRKEKEKEAWGTFKYEIVRLAHTLKLKGWRRVPLDQSGEISVDRLSGALTNAVYVVSPPADLQPQEDKDGSSLQAPKNPPPKLLLRIYGPQVEHLIDRESELRILKRLARKRIGPRLLGTFTNGRFEEFLNAKPLTPNDLRDSETSKRIAKRMRELHEGIDLLPEEREGGPFVWQNWDKWVDRCEQTVTWLDQQILSGRQGAPRSPAEEWKKRGLVCGLEWRVFRQVVEKYRKWLEEQYGGIEKVKERLVFSHNDTQYGNILRLEPSGKSPLMLPANEHKQLVVIDFEYANANLPGLEFANHFTEWCYNYHDPVPYLCNTKYYPTCDEQYRFIYSYLVHNPTHRAPGGSASNPPTPHLEPLHQSGSTTALAATAAPTSISAFMLDSRAPPGEKYSYQEQEAQHEQETEDEAGRLMAETRLWRLANSAMWTAWGIVQAHIPEMPDFEEKKDVEDKEKTASKEGEELESATAEMRAVADNEKEGGKTDGKEPATKEDGEEDYQDKEEEEEEEFDYLGYAQQRALFVWGDAIRLGIIKPDELPEELRNSVKLVEN